MKKIVGAFVSAALCGAAMVVWPAPTSAMPVIGARALAAGGGDMVNVRAEYRARNPRTSAAHRRAPANGGYVGYPVGGDNVGSIVRDGRGYGYNQFSGQRYYSCMFDEGYGRVRPCDAGGGPN